MSHCINIYYIDDGETKLGQLEEILEVLNQPALEKFQDGFQGCLLSAVKQINNKKQPDSKQIADLIWKAVEDEFGIILVDLRFDDAFWSSHVNEKLSILIEEKCSAAETKCDRFYDAFGSTVPFNFCSTLLGVLEEKGRCCVIVSTQALDEHHQMKSIKSSWVQSLKKADPHEHTALADTIFSLVNDPWMRANLSYRDINRNRVLRANNTTADLFGDDMDHGPQEEGQWSAEEAVESWRDCFIEAVADFVKQIFQRHNVVYPNSNNPNDFWPLRFLYGRHRSMLHRSFLFLISKDPHAVPLGLDFAGSDRYICVSKSVAGSVIYSFYTFISKGFEISSVEETSDTLEIALKGIPPSGRTVRDAREHLNSSYQKYLEHSGNRDAGGNLVKSAESLRNIFGEENAQAEEYNNFIIFRIKMAEETVV